MKALLARLQQKHRTISFPKGEPQLPDRYRGLPILNEAGCETGCRACLEECPTGALAKTDGRLSLDLGRCLFCSRCERACPAGAVRFGRDYRQAVRSRNDLVVGGPEIRRAAALEKKLKILLGRSLKLRQVSAGGCNACEADTNVLTTIVYDIGRFGIQFEASPRHADGLLVTGPVTENMRSALEKTYAAVPDPKIVIACGACAVSGGVFADLPDVQNGVEKTIPVDLFIPGCPPHPLTILDGLLRLAGRING